MDNEILTANPVQTKHNKLYHRVKHISYILVTFPTSQSG